MESLHQRMIDYSFPHYEMSEFTIKNKLGSGASGTVYQGELKVLDESIGCIIKQYSSYNYKKNATHMLYSEFMDEVNIGRKFMSHSKHQIQFYGYSTLKKKDETRLYLLMEKTSSNGDMTKHIYKEKFWKSLTRKEYHESNSYTKMFHEEKYWDYIMKPREKINLIQQMVLAVKDLHSFNIVHCDLKPQNMLVVNNKVKLIDYNASQELHGEKEIEGPSELGTPGYMAKEMYDGWISTQADIYSLGVCMLEIWFGDIWPTQVDCCHKNRKYVLDYLYLLKKDNVELYKLVHKCVSTDTKKRLSIKTILSNLSHIRSLIE